MNLSDKAITEVRANTRLKNLIAAEVEVHFSTIDRWVKDNSDNLTKASILNLIHRETGIPMADLLTEKLTA